MGIYDNDNSNLESKVIEKQTSTTCKVYNFNLIPEYWQALKEPISYTYCVLEKKKYPNQQKNI